MFSEDLQSMKYAELQKLAKNAGIRAKQKIDKLIKALTEHYESHQDGTMEQDADLSETETKIEDLKETCSKVLSEGAPKTNGKSKKRKRTFELEEPTLKGDSTPVIENDQPRVTRLQTSRNNTPQSENSESQPMKKLRRSTYDKKSPTPHDKNTHDSGSPGTRAIIDSINGDCSSAERKEKLLSAIGKKVQMKMVSSPSNAVKNQPSQIPRFMAFLTNKNRDQPNSSTPGSKTWDKIHQKEFAKFDSIDVYLEKKQQRKENLSASTKKRLMTKKSPAAKPFSNASKQLSKVNEASKNFKPTVMSAKNINFDFSKLSDSNKTPKSKAVNTPSRKLGPMSTNLPSTKKATRTTPFKFTGNTNMFSGNSSTLNMTVTSSKKNPFDLKASLAKPLTWKPHTGKLKPVATHSASVSRSANVNSQNRARNVQSRDSSNKLRQVQAKNIRRAAQLDRRSNQKYMDMMKRRGLLA